MRDEIVFKLMKAQYDTEFEDIMYKYSIEEKDLPGKAMNHYEKIKRNREPLDFNRPRYIPPDDEI